MAVERRLTLSTSCLYRAGYTSTTTMVDDLVAAGLDRVELSHCPPLTEGELDRLAARTDVALNAHNYFPPADPPFVMNLASPDPENLALSLGMGRRAVAINAALGATVYAVHAGFCAELSVKSLGKGLEFGPIAPPEQVEATMIASLRELADFGAAQKTPVTIAVENHPVEARNLIDGENKLLPFAEPGQLRALIKKVDRPNVGILLDVGHLNVSASVLGFDRTAWIDDAQDLVVQLHLSDNDGVADRNWRIQPDSWVIALLREREAFEDLLWTLEIGFDDVPSAAEHVLALEKLLGL